MNVPLYPGHRPGNRVVPAAARPETQIERRNAERLRTLRAHQRGYYLPRIQAALTNLHDWRELDGRRRRQVLAFLNAGEQPPGWLAQSLRDTAADIARISAGLRVLRDRVWDLFDTAFPEEQQEGREAA